MLVRVCVCACVCLRARVVLSRGVCPPAALATTRRHARIGHPSPPPPAGEDLCKIQAGTWVAWKTPADNAAAGGPLFVADTFYNFLLPQRPNTV
jgi:hypothetical protein